MAALPVSNQEHDVDETQRSPLRHGDSVPWPRLCHLDATQAARHGCGTARGADHPRRPPRQRRARRGSDLARLTAAARIVLDAGLEVWFSPAIFEYPPEETQSRLVACGGGCRAAGEGPPGSRSLRGGLRAHALREGTAPGRSLLGRLKHLKRPSRPSCGTGSSTRSWRASSRGWAPLSPDRSPMRRSCSSRWIGNPSTTSALITTASNGPKTGTSRCSRHWLTPANRSPSRS